MSEKKWISAATLLGLLALATPAHADEPKMKVEDLPRAVSKAFQDKYPGAKVRGLAKEVEDGKTMYEVELTVDGKNVDLMIEPDGEIETTEKQIETDDLPKAVLKAAMAKFPKGKIEKVEEVTTEGDKVVYELMIATGGAKAVEVVMAANGKIVEKAAKEAEDKDKKEKDEEEDDEKEVKADNEKAGAKANKKDKDEDDEEDEADEKEMKAKKKAKAGAKAKKKDKDEDDEEDEDDDDDDEKEMKGKKKAKAGEKAKKKDKDDESVA